ncbi:MAG TPA: SWIB/MDM2 domain-containing protein [Candidatus Thermoplasmatota archaeon]|jgi:chromatin remodeling complex protein RSC6|nr:SWIB/MDM2 domain-containing protein [Candidatus Thermoplasmatota archaeon]
MARNTALSQPVKVSPELAAIIGKNEAPRTEITKKIWEHIKKTKGAQEGRMIHPEVDAKLKAVLGDKPLDMLQMTSVLNKKHIKK